MMNSLFCLSLFLVVSCSSTQDLFKKPNPINYRYKKIDDHKIFYRESGSKNNPVILLLHGFPSSSHTYRNLIPLLSADYYVIAPDNLGSGYSEFPSPQKTTFTFDLLASKISKLLESLEIKKYYIYMQDFGAPVGFRLALSSPEKVQGLIVQNANAYLDGLSPQKRNFFMTAGDKKGKFPRSKLYNHVSSEAIKYKQYLRDVPKEKKYIMSPDTWTHDQLLLSTPERKLVQLQLFQDYRNNLKSYPEWQAYLRKYQPPTLIVWGKKDPVFMHPGATAFLRDVPKAELHLLDAGHFALEERPFEIAEKVLKFLSKRK